MLARDISKIYAELSGIKEKRLPIKVSFVLSRNINKLEKINDDIEASRRDLIQKYADKDDNGNVIEQKDGTVRIDAGNIKYYMDELNDIMDVDIEVTFEKLNMEDIEKCDGGTYDKLTVGEIGAMDQMINTEEM